MDNGMGSGFQTIAGGEQQIHLFTFFQARALPVEGARQLQVFETSSAYY
jgi:hypothetical protein